MLHGCSLLGFISNVWPPFVEAHAASLQLVTQSWRSCNCLFYRPNVRPISVMLVPGFASCCWRSFKCTKSVILLRKQFS